MMVSTQHHPVALHRQGLTHRPRTRVQRLANPVGAVATCLLGPKGDLRYPRASTMRRRCVHVMHTGCDVGCTCHQSGSGVLACCVLPGPPWQGLPVILRRREGYVVLCFSFFRNS